MQQQPSCPGTQLKQSRRDSARGSGAAARSRAVHASARRTTQIAHAVGAQVEAQWPPCAEGFDANWSNRDMPEHECVWYGAIVRGVTHVGREAQYSLLYADGGEATGVGAQHVRAPARKCDPAAPACPVTGKGHKRKQPPPSAARTATAPRIKKVRGASGKRARAGHGHGELRVSHQERLDEFWRYLHRRMCAFERAPPPRAPGSVLRSRRPRPRPRPLLFAAVFGAFFGFEIVARSAASLREQRTSGADTSASAGCTADASAVSTVGVS